MGHMCYFYLAAESMSFVYLRMREAPPVPFSLLLAMLSALLFIELRQWLFLIKLLSQPVCTLANGRLLAFIDVVSSVNSSYGCIYCVLIEMLRVRLQQCIPICLGEYPDLPAYLLRCTLANFVVYSKGGGGRLCRSSIQENNDERQSNSITIQVATQKEAKNQRSRYRIFNGMIRNGAATYGADHTYRLCAMLSTTGVPGHWPRHPI